MRWAKKKKIPLVFTWHTLYDQYTNFVPFLPKKFVADYMIKKAVAYANKVDAVVVPTESIIPRLREWGVRKEIFPIATGVREEEFQDVDGKKIREKFGIKEDEIVLLMVSRLTEEKNVEFVFRSVRDILKNKKAKFLVISDGYLLPKLIKFCEDNGIREKVIFAGVISRKEIKNYFAAGDIFVYGSVSETQGMIITEAMYMGLPIVAVDATGPRSLILNNGNGFLVREDEKEFSEAVERLIDDADLQQRFGENSKRIAKQNFTAEICAKKMLEVYKKAIENYSK